MAFTQRQRREPARIALDVPGTLLPWLRAAAQRGHGGQLTAERWQAVIRWAARARASGSPVDARQLAGIQDGTRDLVTAPGGAIACVRRVDPRARLVVRDPGAVWADGAGAGAGAVAVE